MKIVLKLFFRDTYTRVYRAVPRVKNKHALFQNNNNKKNTRLIRLFLENVCVSTEIAESFIRKSIIHYVGTLLVEALNMHEYVQLKH